MWASLCRVPDECPEEIASLIKDCLSPDPEARPSSTVIFHVLQQQAALAPKLSASTAAEGSLSRGAPLEGTPCDGDLEPLRRYGRLMEFLISTECPLKAGTERLSHGPSGLKSCVVPTQGGDKPNVCCCPLAEGAEQERLRG